MTWRRLVLMVLMTVVGSVAIDAVRAQDVTPRTLAVCDAEALDLKEELVKTQDALAQWQARAIRAEAQIALQAIAQQREKAKGAAATSPPK